MDEIQAAALSVKLPMLDGWNKRRREIATDYSRRIQNPKIQTPEISGEDHVAHLYVVECENRNAFQSHLGRNGIASGIHYPIPDHRQPSMQGRPFFADGLRVTENLADRVVTLPCFPEMTDEEVSSVIDCVNDW